MNLNILYIDPPGGLGVLGYENWINRGGKYLQEIRAAEINEVDGLIRVRGTWVKWNYHSIDEAFGEMIDATSTQGLELQELGLDVIEVGWLFKRKVIASGWYVEDVEPIDVLVPPQCVWSDLNEPTKSLKI